MAAVHRKFLDRSGNVVAAAMEDHRERRVVEDGVVGRTVAGVHQTGIFSERGIAEAVVAVLDGPVPAIECQQPLCVRLLGGQRGDAVGHFVGIDAGLEGVAVADDPKHLLDLRVVEHAGLGFHGLDVALLDAAMALAGLLAEARRGGLIPVDGVQRCVGLGSVALDRQQIMGAVAVQDGGGRVTGGVQSIEGDHRTADVDLLQEGSDGSDLTTLVGEDAAADRLLVVVADQGHGLVLGLALAVGAAQALAIGGQCGGGGGTRRQPAVGGGLKGIRIGVGHGAVEGGAGGWMVASGALVAPSAEGAQLILSKMTGVAPGGIDAVITGQPRQLPDRQQDRKSELATLAAAMIGDTLQFLQQRG